MNRRGFLGTLTALAGLALAKIKAPAQPVDYEAVPYIGDFRPGAVQMTGDELFRGCVEPGYEILSYNPAELMRTGQPLPTGDLIIFRPEAVYRYPFTPNSIDKTR